MKKILSVLLPLFLLSCASEEQIRSNILRNKENYYLQNDFSNIKFQQIYKREGTFECTDNFKLNLNNPEKIEIYLDKKFLYFFTNGQVYSFDNLSDKVSDNEFNAVIYKKNNDKIIEKLDSHAAQRGNNTIDGVWKQNLKISNDSIILSFPKSYRKCSIYKVVK